MRSRVGTKFPHFGSYQGLAASTDINRPKSGSTVSTPWMKCRVHWLALLLQRLLSCAVAITVQPGPIPDLLPP